jgi:threonine/homoserine/homoserine lactone efflux protein
MTTDQVLALAAFALIVSITPGPNNIMLLASGVNFGFARTLPHMFGIVFGLVAMLLGVGIGLGALLQTSPVIATAIKALSLLYLLWLAWGIGTSGDGSESAEGQASEAGPLSFLGAAMFQWVNPKAWTMALTAIGAYSAPTALGASLAVISVVFFVVGVPSVGVWTVFGVGLRRWLADPGRRKVFNVAMALLLVLSVVPIAGELAVELAGRLRN